jgi:iron complex outermembrane receptor protein
MNSLLQKLMIGASTTAIVASSLIDSSVIAQPAAQAESIEQVVVTGSSIKGSGAVGSNVIQLDQKNITEIGVQNVTEALVDMPAIEGFGNAGRAATSATNGQPGVSLYIHDVGAMGTGSTLVLIDGHRAVESGQTNYFVNPNILPTNMLERVDVLTDGSSAVYGSDAIAGVINFITRKQFEGLQVTAQETFEDGTSDNKENILIGHSWDNGNFILAAEYATDGLLKNTSRPWTSPLAQTARAAAAGITGPNTTNFGNFNCEPATIQPSGSSGIYLSATSTSTKANTAANSPCGDAAWAAGALLPEENRKSAMMKVTQEFGSRITVTADMLVSSRQNYAPTSRGTLTATAFGTGAQANPFYINPPGVTATQQQVRYDFDALLGPGAYTKGTEDTLQASASFTYNVDDNWEIEFLSVAGRDINGTNTFNTVNGAAANLALNGSAQVSGSLTTSDIPGYTGANVTNLPLTAANALDVWNPVATNRTSQSTLQGLTNNETLAQGIYSVIQERLSAQGTVFDLPAGPVKLAFGAELWDYKINGLGFKPGLAAPQTADSTSFDIFTHRNDVAEYAEVDVPVVAPEMGIPLLEKFTVNLAVRRDDYSDVGATINPKAGFDWTIIDDVKVRANWSTSFQAPVLTLEGQNGVTNFANIGGATGGGSILVALYPQVTQLGIPGCTTASVSCSITTIQGINKTEGNPNLGVAHGRSWSVGADFTPSWLAGFNTDVTYWNTELLGGVVGPPFAITTTNPTFASTYLTLYPSCASAATIAAFAHTLPNPSKGIPSQPLPQTSAFPACVQFLYQNVPNNFQYNYVAGVDLTASYHVPSEDIFGEDVGSFTLATNWTEITQFDDAFNLGTPTQSQIFSTLNSDGYNTGFPSIGRKVRSHLGWVWKGLLADIWVNYTGAYHNWSSTAINPITNNANGYINGGGDHVKANVTFDAHIGYSFDGGMFGDDMLSLVVDNVFDKTPPFYNIAAGYDVNEGNPNGRTISLSLTIKK